MVLNMASWKVGKMDVLISASPGEEETARIKSYCYVAESGFQVKASDSDPLDRNQCG